MANRQEIIVPITGVQSMDSALARLARQAKQARTDANTFEDKTGCPLLNGKHITGVTIGAALTKDINHGLGRVPIGWFVTSCTEGNMLAEVSRSATKLRLGNKGALSNTFSVWVF